MQAHALPPDFARRLPEPDRPFPIDAGRWSTLPGMARLGEQSLHGRVERGHFRLDQTLPRYLAEKLEVLAASATAHRCIDPDRDAPALARALWRVLGVLGEEYPALARRDGEAWVLPTLGLGIAAGDGAEDVRLLPGPDAAPWPRLADLARRHLEETAGLDRLADALALACQEDYAIVRGPEGTMEDGDRAELLHIAFPSHWDPRTKLGRDFGTIHAPVAHNDAILKARRSLVRAMIEKGPFVRYAWGIAVDGRLGFHTGTGQAAPSIAPEILSDPDAVARRAHLRVERQTTFAMTDLNRGLFTIRVYVTPVTEVATDPWRRQMLRDALASMDDEALAYKGLEALRDPLVAWLAD
jgi:dimethylamine monooxygenase subunit A